MEAHLGKNFVEQTWAIGDFFDHGKFQVEAMTIIVCQKTLLRFSRKLFRKIRFPEIPKTYNN